MKRKVLVVAAMVVVAGAVLALAVPAVRSRVLGVAAIARSAGPRTVDERLAEFSARCEPIWRARCEKAGMNWPPSSIVLVGLKQEKQLLIYARDRAGKAIQLASYPILAASGGSGPKLREGDRQVPEGVYAIESFNPNSRFHVALRVSYPSDADRAQAKLDGRELSTLGGDIMIHGSDASIGCLAMGDGAIEEIFYLAASVGRERIEVILSPGAEAQRFIKSDTPDWIAARYREIAQRLSVLR